MKVKTIIKTGQLFMMAVLLAACASEDIAQDKKKENGTEAPKGGVIFAANGPKASAKRLSIDGEEETADAKTRTILKHTPGQGADAYWKWDDFIWVKDKNGTWQKSTHIELHDGGASAEFTLPGSKADYLNGCEVHYTGHGSSAFYATPESATSVGLYKHYDFPTANDYTWAGHIGDCGSGKAMATGNPDKFNFTLVHKPAYLCFLPRCENAALAPNIRLTHIKMTATKCYNNPSSNLVDLFDFDGETIGPGAQGSAGSNVIDIDILNFPLTTAANPEANATYVIVRPDTYDFKIEYTIKDVGNGMEAIVIQTLTNITLNKGEISDIRERVDERIKNTGPDVRFCLWDAKQDYWYGRENERPTIPKGQPGATQSNIFPSTPTDLRWQNQHYPSGPYAAEQLCKDCPNVNEMCWYVKRGDPHWENNVVYEEGGHLKKASGVWLKTKAAIIRDNSDIDEDRFTNRYPNYLNVDYDWRTELVHGYPTAYTTCSSTLLSNTADYFFLPAWGEYGNGWLWGLNTIGRYWSSTADPQDYQMSFILGFSTSSVTVNRMNTLSVFPYTTKFE